MFWVATHFTLNLFGMGLLDSNHKPLCNLKKVTVIWTVTKQTAQARCNFKMSTNLTNVFFRNWSLRSKSFSTQAWTFSSPAPIYTKTKAAWRAEGSSHCKPTGNLETVSLVPHYIHRQQCWHHLRKHIHLGHVGDTSNWPVKEGHTVSLPPFCCRKSLDNVLCGKGDAGR